MDTNGKKKKKMTLKDWAILTGKVALNASAAPLKGALWALERPQQAVFNAAHAGSGKFGSTMTQLSNAGWSEPVAVLGGLAASVPALRRGAGKGLVGLGKQLSGSDLTKGLTGNETIDSAIGLGLDLTADPVLPSNTKVEQVAGRMLRTAWNLRKATTRQKALLRKLGPRRHFLDVPVPPGPDAPLLSKTKRPVGHLAGKLFPDDPRVARYPERYPGWNYDGIVAVQKKALAGSYPHEAVHWRLGQVPVHRRPTVNQRLARLAREEREMARRLRRRPSYSHLDDAGIGNEILARNETFVMDPVLRRVQAKAWGAVNPGIFKDPRGVPINIPWSLRKVYKWAIE